MIEILEKILHLLQRKSQKQTFVFRFYIFNDSVENKQIKISNSLEYTFINYGTSVIILNETFRLYPSWVGHGNKITFRCNENEIDETVYTYRFRNDINIKNGDTVCGFNSLAEGVNYITTNAPRNFFDFGTENKATPLNLLQVVIKEKR